MVAACGTVPDQKFLKPGSLSGIGKIGIIASSHDLTVRKHRESNEVNPVMLFFPLTAVILEPIDWAIKSSADASNAHSLQANRPKVAIAGRFSSHFTQRLAKSRVFESVQEIPADTRGDQPADWRSGLDAVIRLRVADISLRPVTRDELSLFVEVSAEMVSLNQGKEQALLWSRVERVHDNEMYTLDFYKKNGVSVLDHTLEKLASRLADDLIYSK